MLPIRQAGPAAGTHPTTPLPEVADWFFLVGDDPPAAVHWLGGGNWQVRPGCPDSRDGGR
jgi:hypothetical protein